MEENIRKLGDWDEISFTYPEGYEQFIESVAGELDPEFLRAVLPGFMVGLCALI